ncbi:tetratricopeptide repeat protein [Novosphingobium resinovorum]|uniref:tetratricopeptide repeat protein n=1 Tax=Novosphingobium resinovorum TaxID=158500 RepID=UPI002ED3F848|nr:tetratricopeptide repeat protein [Novosphingobium resinovorum]
MKRHLLAALGCAAMIAGTAGATEATIDTGGDEADQATITRAFGLIGQKQAAQALDLVAPLLTRFDAQIVQAETQGMVFCGPNMMEAIIYATLPGTQKKNGVVLGPQVCDALYAKSYALIELGRRPEALAALQRLTALAPMHGQYFIELGYAYRINGQNDKAEEAYRSALEHADFAEDDKTKKHTRAAARRGIGYMLIEKGDLNGAEKAYRQSLKDDPDSPVARNELDFIAQQRKTAK